jgi:HK97 family phage major capsid protein/HK97 family phage prohead protease
VRPPGYAHRGRGVPTEIVRKSRIAEPSSELEYVLSDATVDRYGDVVDPSGWEPASLKGHVSALFNHDGGFVVGKWIDLRVERGGLRGRFVPAAKGTSARIDEVISLSEQGLLPGVSVGFSNLESEPLNPTTKRGKRYKRQALLECSFVSVPANPNAMQIARGLVSDETIRLCFGEPATASTRGPGEPASTQHRQASGTPGMSNLLSARIEAAQSRLNGLKDELTAHSTACGDVMTEAETATFDDLNNRVETEQRQLETLQRTERNMAQQTAETMQQVTPGVYARQTAVAPSAAPRPFAVPAARVEPGERYLRSLIAIMHSKASLEMPDGYKSPAQCLAERYGEDGKIDEVSRLVLSHVMRAASAPADTTTTGWASQLVQTDVRGFMDVLYPLSVYPGLASRGQRLGFGRAGSITIPTWSSTPSIGGSFVAEGAPIPVRQGALTSVSLGPKKLGVITVYTREIATYSNPTIEALLRSRIQAQTSQAIDSILLDATVASSVRPPGLRAGVAALTATTGGGFNALVGDLKQLLGALVTGSAGNLRSPTWIMNPAQAISIALTQSAGGLFPFQGAIEGGSFYGYPVIQSGSVTAGMVIIVDAADFVSVEGDAPMFTVSAEATLHMEDTTPLAIGTVGSPATVAAPVRSTFQTDCIALRMIMPLNWSLLRVGTLAWTQSVTW